MKTEWQKEYGKWINRLRFKTVWRQYMNMEIKYSEYKDTCFRIVNDIRQAVGNPPYSFKKFDEAWQYRNLCKDKYSETYDELINVIYGWW